MAELHETDTSDTSPPPQVASCLIFNKTGRLLLLRRHLEDQGGGLWAVPGGGQEPGESLVGTVVREVLEETGLRLPLETAVFLGTHEIRMPHGAIHMHTFRARVANGVSVATDPRAHSEYGWFAPSELLALPGTIWGLPTILRDFGLMGRFETDPTLADPAAIVLINRGGELT